MIFVTNIWSVTLHVKCICEYDAHHISVKKVRHFIPCCNKDQVCSKVQAREIQINVLCGLLDNTSTGVLAVENLASISVVQIYPKCCNDVPGAVQWKPLRCMSTKWRVKGQVSIMVYLEGNNKIGFIINSVCIYLFNQTSYFWQHHIRSFILLEHSIP